MTKKFYLDMHREQLKYLIPLYQTAFREASYKQLLIHLQKNGSLSVRAGNRPLFIIKLFKINVIERNVEENVVGGCHIG